jgi:OOP family OmpA-OmpF porin
MLKQRIMGVIALGSLGIAMAAPATAEVQPGWYIGVSPGQSSFDISKDELDDVIVSAYASAGAPLISGSSTFDDSDTSWSIFGGYRFNPFIAVEAGYVDLGNAPYRSSGNVNPPGPVASTPASANIDFSSTGITIAAVGSLPLGEMFDLHARLGLLFADTEIDLSTAIGTGRASDTLSSSSEDALYGIGAALHVGASWTLSVDWQRFVDVGDEEETGEGDIDLLSLAAAYRF